MAIHEKNINVTSEHRTDSRAVGVFKRKEDVEHVIRSLKDNDYDMNRVSMLARNVDQVEGSEELEKGEGNEASEGAGIGATTGTVLGGVTGFLIGVGVLAIPGIGPVLAAGAEISALGSTLAGAGIGAATGGIVGALVGMGIPEERAKVYEDRVKAGDYLLIVSGNEDELHHVESIMGDRNVEEFEIFGGKDYTREDVQVDRTHRNTATTVAGRDLDQDGEPEVVIHDKRNEKR
jgi:hypothetical protein